MWPRFEPHDTFKIEKIEINAHYNGVLNGSCQVTFNKNKTEAVSALPKKLFVLMGS
jgi:hypothetical protein